MIRIKNTINLLFYSEKWCSGGIEAFIMNIYRNLNKEKFKVSILTSQNETNMYDEEIKSLGGIKTTTLDKKYNSPIIRTLKNFSRFKKNMLENKYDVVHLNICHGVALIYAYHAKKSGVKKVIAHSHNSDVGNHGKIFKLMGHKISKILFLKYVDEFFSCSDLASNWLYTKEVNNFKKVKIINNAIDSSKFAFNLEERNKVRKKLNINDELLIGNIGRFNEQKNHNYLIEIFNEIYKLNKKTKLILIGDGELQDNIKDKVNQLGLEKQVIFYGITNDIPELLWAMDIFLLPSLFEGKPVTIIETQAASLKAYISDVITRTVKFTKYVEYISLEKTPKEWAKLILDSKLDYDRQDMSKVVEKNEYEIKEVTKQLEKIYMEGIM